MNNLLTLKSLLDHGGTAPTRGKPVSVRSRGQVGFSGEAAVEADGHRQLQHPLRCNMKQSCGLFLAVKHLLHLSLTRQYRSTERSPTLIDGQAEWKRCQGANGEKNWGKKEKIKN